MSGDYSNRVIDVGNLSFDPPSRVIEIMGRILNVAPEYELLSGGGSYSIDTTVVERFRGVTDLALGGDYLEKIIFKYFGDQ